MPEKKQVLMNKVILGLILAVCILGMALVMLNERLGRKTESASTQTQTEKAENAAPPESETWQQSVPPQAPPAVEAERARAMEIAEARENLAPPMREDATVKVPVLPESRPMAEEAREENRPQLPPAPAIVEQTPVETPSAAEKQQTASAQKASPAASAEIRKAPKTEKEQPKNAAQSSARVINRFVVFARDGGATIRVGSPAKISFTNMTLENPDRVVVDMDGTWQFPANPGIPKNEMVSKIRTGKLGDKTRVVIDLKGKPRSVRVIPAKTGDGFDVRVDK